jgi:hypothetical protein
MGVFIDWDERSEAERLHDRAVARQTRARLATIEKRLRKLAAPARSSEDGDRAEMRAKMEMAQAELEFWRARLARSLEGGTRAGRERGDFWLVPRTPSERALRLANGLTDLADISCSPHDMAATAAEIGRAVRIVIEEDGVPVDFEPGERTGSKRTVTDADEERKRLLLDASDLRAALVGALVRNELLSGALDRDAALGERFFPGPEREGVAASVAALKQSICPPT